MLFRSPGEYYRIHKECQNKLYFSEDDIDRDDPILVQVVEELGKESWGYCSELKIVEIPENIKYYIQYNKCTNQAMFRQKF